MRKEEREFYKNIGLCPVCGKNKLFKNEKSCPECKAYNANYKSDARESNRREYNNIMKIYHKSHYKELKDKGLCVRCGRKKALNNKTRCGICTEKMERKRKERKAREGVGFTRQQWIDSGLCFYCGEKAIDGFKVCQKHYELNIKNALKSNKEVGRIMNNLMFVNR